MTAVIPAQRKYDSPEVNEVDLVERAQAGDREALGELYARHYRMVFRIINSKVRDYSLTEDLVADVFTRMVASIGSFRWQGSDFGAWLNTIARNRVADHFKSSRFRCEVSTDEPMRETVDVSREANPDLTVLAYLASVELLSAVKTLMPLQERVLVLRFVNGLSLQETAVAMGRNEGAVKSLQMRACRALSRILSDSAVAR